jgi:predicted DNA-binding transcriptional regulator YafY
MIRIYKEDLEKAGIFIDTIKGPYGGYVLNQNINVPKRFISPNAINIKNKELYNLINRAIKEKRKCSIDYYSKDKKGLSTRIIHPYDLILLGSEWGVAAYCEKKEEIRHFYLNRIKTIKILDIFYN